MLFCLQKILLLTLFIYGIPSQTVPALIQNQDAGRNRNSNVRSILQHRECGSVYTETGKTVILREGMPLSPEEFQKVHVRKLKGAVFEPIKARNCAINVCGFAAWGDGEYADCELFEKQKRVRATDIYNDFNTSSIMCGCQGSADDCSNNDCVSRASEMNWSENDCAVLFQEKSCNNCYFPPVVLSNGERFIKNYSHHFLSLIVRKGCSLQLDAPGFAWWGNYKDMVIPSQPIIYPEDSTWDPVDSAYQSDPETFYCTCKSTPPPVDSTTPVILNPPPPNPPTAASSPDPPTKKNQPSYSGPNMGVYFFIVGGVVFVLITAMFVGFLIWRKRLNDQMDVVTPNNQIESFDALHNVFKNVCKDENLIGWEEFSISTEHLKEPLGAGRYGIVYRGTLRQKSDGLCEKVAVKKIQWSVAREHIMGSFLRELKTFQKIGIQNENIVRFMGACCHKDGLFLLTEFCEGGSIADQLAKMRQEIVIETPPAIEMIEGDDSYFHTNREAENRFMEERRQQELTSEQQYRLIYWCEQIASGMEYLSLKEIIHVDLAARNTLLKLGVVKICDFGLSKEFCAQSLISGEFPLNSFAPELNASSGPLNVSVQVDVWAYGCTIWEMFTLGDPLYPDVKEKGPFKIQEVSRLLSLLYRHPKPPLAPNYVYDKILMKCWQEKPEDRPNFTYLREFFHTIRVDDRENRGFGSD